MYPNPSSTEPQVKIWPDWRAGLLASTALSAVLVSPLPARAQISPTATPQGGVVVGGSATIIQAPGSTTIDQSSQRAAINFQSFDVGSAAQVQINQPNANSVELDRVVGGNLSQINGQINSNGQVVLINQSGVVFGKGAQVNAENIVVSTSNIATADFMNGHMVFSGAPNPGAQIINNGHITARQAGLVGLVAPQVANNGVITATLGQVVLAGASAFTLDLYGDRLITLNVTKAVQAVNVGGKLVPALVTNSGLILADGGKITLTAQDADALVTQLINAGGTILANSIGANTGTISIQGVGGNISIAGNLLAQGQGGAAGGKIQAMTTGAVAVASTAVLDASGDSNGGVIALGTNLARAEAGALDRAAPKAASVIVVPGAILRADATANGNGGKIILLSKQNTNFAGTISVAGGPNGGDGGIAEISSDNLIALGGSVADNAPHGQAGEVLLDPATLVIAADGTVAAGSAGVLGDITYGTDNSTVSYISPSVLDSLSGTIVLEASTLISVLDAVSIASPNTALSLISGGDVSIDNAIYVNGSLEIDAVNSLGIAGDLAATNISLNSGVPGTDINAEIDAFDHLNLGSSGTIFEDSNGFIVAPDLSSQGTIGGDALLAANNTITTLGEFAVSGNLILNNEGGLTAGGPISASNISLSAASLTFEGNVSTKGLLALTSTGTIFQGAGIISAGTLTGSADGEFVLARGSNKIATLGSVTATGDNFSLTDTGLVTVSGPVSGKAISLSSGTINLAGNITASTRLALGSTGTITQSGGSITAGTLSSIGTIGGDVSLASATNDIGTLGNFTLGGNLDLNDSTVLHIAGTVATPESITLAATGGITEPGGIDAGTLSSGGTIDANIIAVELTGTNEIGTLGNFAVTAGNFALVDGESLIIAGTVYDSGEFQHYGAGVTETGAGLIEANGFGSVFQSVSGNILLTGNNSISAIYDLDATGTFDLNNKVSLAVNGDVSAASVSIATPTLALMADVQAAAGGTLAVAADDIIGGGSLLAPDGTISIAPLDAGTIIDIGNASSAGTLGLPEPVISQLNGTAAEIIIGNGPVGTQASAIEINRSVSFGGTSIVDLSTSGLISQNAGTLHAATLEFDSAGFTQNAAAAIDAETLQGDGVIIAGNVSLNGSNEIGYLEKLSALNLIVNDTGGLTAGPSVSAGNISLSAASITFEGNVSAKGLLALTSTGTISQGQGNISAGTLTGSAIGLFALDDHANSIGTIGSVVASGGEFSIVDSGLLTVDGPVSGLVVKLYSDTIDLAGNITTPTELALGSTGTIIQSAGSITTGQLISEGTIGGDALLTGNNIITTLGDFAVNGNLILDNAGGLTAGGPVSASNISLSAASLTFEGNLATQGLLALTSTGTIFQGAGTISAGTLTGSADGEFALARGGNKIATLGSVTATDNYFSLTDTGLLTVAGPVSGPVISISSDTINLAGNITAPTELALGSTGSITQTAGSLTTAQLTSEGSIGGNVILTAANSIASLSAFSLGGTLDLADTRLLTVTGPLSGPVVSITSDTINLAGNITAPTELALGSTGTITQTAGSITTGQLTSKGSIGGDVILTAANSIATLSAFTLGGTFDLADTGLLTISGPVTGPVISIASDTIDVAGNITAPTQLALGSTGSITQIAGSISTGMLTSEGSIGGNVILTAANSIATLSAFTLGGTLNLADTGLLTVTGPVSGPVVSLASDTINLAGNITVPSELALGATGSITQTAGSITTGTLTSEGSIGSDALFTSTVNSIGTLGNFAAGGTLALFDSIALDAAGTIAAPVISLSAAGIIFNGDLTAPTELALGGTGDISQHSGVIETGSLVSIGTVAGNADLGTGGSASIAAIGDFSLTNAFDLQNASSVLITGLLSTPAGQVSFAGRGVTETGAGAIDASELQTNVQGDVLLTGNNSIGVIGPLGVSATGIFALNNTADLEIAGNIGAADVTIAAPSIALDNGVTIAANATTPTLALASNALAFAGSNQLQADGGTIFIAPLAPGDGIDIGGTMANALDITGPLTGVFPAGAAEIIIGNGPAGHQASAIAIDNSVSFGGTSIVDLSTTGLISQNAGTLTAATLEFDSTGFRQSPAAAINAAILQGDGGSITGSVLLTGSKNLIGELTALSLSSGTLDVQDNATLTVAGTVSAPMITLSAFPSLNLSGLLNAPTALSLGSGGNISEPGSISTGLLTSQGNIGGNAALTGSNNIGTLGGFLVNGTLDLADAGSLGITGPVDGSSITLAAAGIGFTGAVTASNILALASTAGITQSGGGIIAGTLASVGSIGGNVILTAANSISVLASFTLGGTLDLANTGLLTITGPVSGPVISLASGTIDFAGNISAPTELALGGSANITQTAGSITTGQLTSEGLIGGNVILTAANSIASLSAFTLGGTLDLADTGLLDVTGPLSGPVISLASGTIDLAGNIFAPTELALGSSGNITQTAGSITAGQLTSEGSIGGNVILNAANSIASLSAFTLGGTLDLADTGLLDVTGPVSGPVVSLASDTIDLAGNIFAPTELALGSTGDITQNAGSITTAELTSEGSIGGNVILTAANSIASLSAFTLGGTLDFADTGLLTVTGPVSGPVISLASGTINLAGNITAGSVLDLDATTAGIDQTASAISTPTLTSAGQTIAGSANLSQPNNNIATISGFATTGNVTLADATTLTIGGPFNAANAAFTAPQITVGGLIGTAGTLILAGANGVSETSTGQILSALFSTGPGSINGNIDLNTPGNSIAALGSIDGAAGLTLNNNIALSLTAPVSLGGTLALLDPASITQTAGTITAAALTSDNGTIGGNVSLDQPGNDIPELGNFAAAGSLSLHDHTALNLAGTIDAAALSLTSTGALTQSGIVVTPVLNAAATSIILADANSIGTLGTIATSLLRVNGIDGIAGPLTASTATLTSEAAFSISGNASVTNQLIIAAADGISQSGGSVTAGQATFTTPGDFSQTAGTIAASIITISAVNDEFAGVISAPVQLALASTGTITQIAGSIIAGTLISQGRIGGDVILSSTNSIASLGAFTLGGTLDLTDTGLLIVTGPVSGPVISLSSNTINLAGDITAPDQLAFGSTGAITQTAGSITTGQLTSEGSIGGNVILTDANSIASLTAFTLGGTLNLADTGLLDVTGPVLGPVISLASDTIDLAGNIFAPVQLVLGSAGNITQTAGNITTNQLTSEGTIGGAVILTAANSIATLSAFSAAGTLDLANTGLLTVTGPLSAPAISLASDTINLAGNITVPVQLALGSAGSITQTAGSITTTDLTSLGTIGGDARFTRNSNSIGTLGGFLAAGTLALDDARLLTTTGTITAPIVSLSADGIIFDGQVNAATELALGGTGNIITSAGALDAGSLVSIGTIGGTADLTRATIAAIGNLSLSGAFTLANATSAQITGLISAPGGVVFENGGVTETGAGAIDASQLDTSGIGISGDLLLTGANTISSIDHAGVTASGIFALNDTSSLSVEGNVAATGVTLIAAGIDLASNIFAPAELALGGTGGITQTAGNITTGQLSSAGSIGGNVILTAANSIASLSAFTLGGTLDLADTGLLTVTGPVSGPFISLASDTIGLAGNIFAPTELALGSPGNITQTAGSITTGQLTSEGSIGGNVILTAANSIASLTAFTVGGTLDLNDTGLLTVTGPVSGPVISLASDTIDLAGNIFAPTELALGGTGDITQTAGIITTAQLSSEGSIGGNVILTAANSIASLSAFTLGGTLDLADTGLLTVTGPVSGPVISLASGSIDLAGNIFAPTQLAFGSTGGVTQTAGSITTGQLTSEGSIGGNVILTAANAIASLSAFTLSGTLDLADTGLLTVTGPVFGPVISIASDTITLAGNLSAANLLSLNSTGDLSQTAGVVTTPALFIAAGNDVTQTGGTISAQNATLSGNNFALSGDTRIADILQINATGSIIHGAGILTAATFTGSAPQFASFAADTDFATLGSFIMQDSQFILANTGSLVITGPVVASSVDISAAGQITLQGSPDGGLFIKGSIAPDKQPSPRPGDSSITSTPGANSPAAIIQTGNFLINTGAPATVYTGTQSQAATIFFTTSPNGSIQFAPFPDELDAPAVDIVVASGLTGSIAGNINVKHLEIQTADSVNLTGAINGVAGSAAAGNGSVYPSPKPQFQFNSCPIGSVNCTILPTDALPSDNPLDKFDVKTRKRKKLDRNVQLPGVATRDF